MPAAPEASRRGASAEETTSLLSGNKAKPDSGDDADDVMRNYLGLCIVFGVSHSCLTVGIAYASSVFDLTLGSASTGLVYTLYTLTSLLAAAPFVDLVGPRNGMTLSVTGFLLYLICFVIGQAADGSNYSLEYTVVIIGSVCGGLSSSIGWVSQGVYYARSAVLYSRATGGSLESANELLAGRFSAICES
jgi:MFS family permease